MKITIAHIETVTGKIWKVLPLFEDKNSGLTAYIGSLIYELEGLSVRLDPQQESMLQTITDVLRHVYDDSLVPDPDLKIIRREILGCTSLFNKIFEFGDYK